MVVWLFLYGPPSSYSLLETCDHIVFKNYGLNRNGFLRFRSLLVFSCGVVWAGDVPKLSTLPVE